MTKKEIQAKKERQLVLTYIQGKYDALLELELMSRNKSITKDILNKIEAEIGKISTGAYATAYTAKYESLKIIEKYYGNPNIDAKGNKIITEL